jgi:hypothetical protein
VIATSAACKAFLAVWEADFASSISCKARGKPMIWERDRTDAGRGIEKVLRIAIPILLTLAGVFYVWRANQIRHTRARQRIYTRAIAGPKEPLPHSDPREETVEAASEDSFPASDPPAYIARHRPALPAR